MTYRQMFQTVRTVMADPRIKGPVAELTHVAKQTFLWMLLSEVVLVLQPYPVKWFYDGLTQTWPALQMYGLCGLMWLIYGLGTYLHNRQVLLRQEFFWQVWATLWGYSHWRELKLGLDWHVQHSTGDKESIVGRNVDKVLRLVDELVFNSIPIAMRIVLTSAGVFLLGLHFGAVAMVTVVAFAFALVRTERVMSPLRTAGHRKSKRIERDGTEMTKCFRTIKQLGIEDDECETHAELLDDFRGHVRTEAVVFGKYWRLQEHIVSLGRVAMYAAMYRWFDPKLGIGTVILAGAWMERIFSNFYRFDEVQRRMNEGKEAAQELCEIFELTPSVRQPEDPRWPEGGLRGKFVLENVCYTFPNGGGEALRGLNLTIEPYETIALVGRSGSGKTTLVSLLSREIDPSEGSVTVDGIDLRELDWDRFRRTMAGVSQRIDLFTGTVEENIRVSRPDATFAEVMEAARLADAHEFISRKEKGYGSPLGEDGIMLSGGERQRVAIARALLRKPPVIFLDEATSSLDAESQAQVQESINHLITRRLATIIIVAHRLSTIRQADRIAVLDKGLIAEIGTHQELMNRNGLYRYFVEREQAGLNDSM